jgi:hypothetical protein
MKFNSSISSSITKVVHKIRNKYNKLIWLNSTSFKLHQAGSIILRQHRFRVLTDLSCLYAASNFVKVWIKILDLDYDMRGYQVLEAVTQPFASLLNLDFTTRIGSIMCSCLHWGWSIIDTSIYVVWSETA